MLNKIAATVLRGLAVAVLRKYKPRIVAISGSVGKSTTKEAVAIVLSGRFFIWKTEKNMNTEIGVPLAVLGLTDQPGRNPFKWLAVVLRGLRLILLRVRYPEILVLEMAADKPGDLFYLTSFIRPNVSIVTNVGVSHIEKFGSQEAIYKEKSALVRALSETGVAVLNADNAQALSMKALTVAKVITYGFSTSADFKAFELEQKSLPTPLIYAFLAAMAAGSVFGISPNEAQGFLRNFRGLPGRLQVLPGISGSVIIDDTYNSAPDSLMAALNFLNDYKGGRKIAVLGKMAELGSESETAHRQVGKEIAKLNLDLLLVKNNEAAWIADSAVNFGFSEDKAIKFTSNEEAVKKLYDLISPDAVVLFKASRAEKFEEIVAKVLNRQNS